MSANLAPTLPLFVYGTLMDPDVLAAVLGRTVPEADWAKAIVKGYRTVAMLAQNYPGLVRAPDAETEGQLLSGLTAEDIARLTAYEGPEYRLTYVTASRTEASEGPRNIAAPTYLPAMPLPPDAPPWSFPHWRREHKSALLAELAESPAAP